MPTITQRLDKFLLGPFYNQALNVLEKETIGAVSLVDLGCGYMPGLKQITRNISQTLGVDVFQPSIDKSQKAQIHSEYIKEDVLTWLEKAETASYDIVMALDLIEHLEKEKGLWLMQQMERIARKKVIIFTPNGFVPQRPYDNNPWQEHKSGWNWDEMQNYGYRTYGFGGYKKWRGERFAIKYKPRIFWKYLSFYSQIITHTTPRLAYSILCVKDLSK